VIPRAAGALAHHLTEHVVFGWVLVPRSTSYRERRAVIDTDRASGATRRMLSPRGLERPAPLRWQLARLGLAAVGIKFGDRKPRHGQFIKRDSTPDCRQANGPTCGLFLCDIVNSSLSAIAARRSRASRTFLC
jgi:hypothetical protein